MKISTERPPRRYSARFCACGSPAIYAVQVLARTLGPGQTGINRRSKLGKPSFVCGQCSRNANARFIEQLGCTGIDALDQVRRPTIQGTPLFDQVEA